MKTPLKLALVVLAAAGVLNASAAIYTYTFNGGFANAGVVPDSNPTGWSDTRTLSGIAESQITDINVVLNVSGGYHGDLYAYLVHGDGFAVLLNRPGLASGSAFGYSDSGFAIRLDDQADVSRDIHLYQTVSGWNIADASAGNAWRPDGRNIDPASPGVAFEAAGQTQMLAQFNGLNPNGSWTLFFADMSAGDQSTVTSWSLEITAVPEPASLALGLFAGLLATAATAKHLGRRRA
jgi:hypothetical protein